MNPAIPIETLKEEYKGMPAFVVGNGIARQQYDITELAGRGLVLGCNKFGEQREYQEKFAGSPCWVGMVDLTMLERMGKRQFWRYFPILTKEKTPNITTYPVPLLSMPTKSWVSAGHGMVIAALQLGCFPIILVGMGSRFSMVQYDKHNTILSDNMYTESYSYDKNALHCRVYGKNHHEGEAGCWHLGWTSEMNVLMRKNPDQIYRIDATSFYEEVPWLDWDETLAAFPKQYRAERDPNRSFLPLKVKRVQTPSVAV